MNTLFRIPIVGRKQIVDVKLEKGTHLFNSSIYKGSAEVTRRIYIGKTTLAILIEL